MNISPASSRLASFIEISSSSWAWPSQSSLKGLLRNTHTTPKEKSCEQINPLNSPTQKHELYVSSMKSLKSKSCLFIITFDFNFASFSESLTTLIEEFDKLPVAWLTLLKPRPHVATTDELGSPNVSDGRLPASSVVWCCFWSFKSWREIFLWHF